MPIYPYSCGEGHTWEEARRMDDRDAPSTCETCKGAGKRGLATFAFSGASDWNTQTYHPGLGCYTRSNKEARQIAKRRGLEEVGTEPPEKIASHFEKKRAEIREERWKDVDRVKAYD